MNHACSVAVGHSSLVYRRCADCLYICAVGHCACRVVEWRLKVNGFRRKDILPMRLWKSTSWSSQQSVSVNFLKHHHWQFLMDQLKWWLPEDLISQSNSFAKLEFLQCLCGTSAKLIWTICKSLLWTAVFYFELEQPVVGIILPVACAIIYQILVWKYGGCDLYFFSDNYCSHFSWIGYDHKFRGQSLIRINISSVWK